MKKSQVPRWIHFDPSSRDEAAHHASVLKRIDAWWQEFRGKTEQLALLFQQKVEWDLPAWMERHLQAIHPQLMWEFGPAVKGKGHRLVITPEAAKHLRPMTTTLLEQAPKLAGWEFYGYRIPEDLENTKLAVEARTGGDIGDVLFDCRIGDHQLIDLTFYSPQTSGADDQQALSEAFVATETLLGEERLDKWIGVIEVAPSPAGRRGKALLPLDKLADRVNAGVVDQLPDKPHFRWADTAEWTLFETKPQEAKDYSDQMDMFVGKSVNQALWTTAHSGTLFHSERFSKCGETFCYVKLDGKDGLDEEKFPDKAAIEDALDEVLRPRRLGCHIGGGTGLRYSYIDLALTDVQQGLDAVRRRLREGNVPKYRSP
jgi:hypothetical protein